MTFTGNEGAPVALATARTWMKAYQDGQAALNPDKTVIKAHFFGKEKIKQLLDENESVGIRIYYGINDEGENTLMLISAKADMDDILPETDVKNGGPIILDDSLGCPPYCPK